MLFSGCAEWAFLLKAIIWEHGILTQTSIAVTAAVANGN